ncbi:MAG: M3 family oligoendopeptidase [Hyphomicrobiales bacterium]
MARNDHRAAAYAALHTRSAAGPAAGLQQLDLADLPQWDLSDLYRAPDSPELTADLARGAGDADRFAATYQGKLADLAGGERGGAALTQAVEAYERLQDLAGRISSYAGLLYAGDTSDPDRSKFYGDMQEKITDISTRLLFFELELNRLDDKVLEAAMTTPELARYAPWLMDLRKEKPYQLEDRIEQVFHEKNVTGRSAWNRLFDETMSALRFKVDGEELAIEPTLSRMLDPDPDKRRAAADALSRTFSDNIRTFTLITNTLAKDKEISDRWRGFEDVADSRHLANRVERPVVDALEQAVRAAYPDLSHRYYGLKAKWLGVERLEHWDRNAPLPDQDTRTVPWDDACSTVLEAYRGFAPEMADCARQFFDRNWIDAPVRPGKAPGAFSHPTVPSAHPYVLLNYQGRTRDVMTLAHELGHGVHQILAAPQGALLAQTPLTLAETASVFGEMLTFRSLLAGTGEAQARKALIASKVEDMINTVVRQIAFYTFERRVHTERREGELTAERLGGIWLEIQEESLGPAIHLDAGYETYWSYIPHFIHAPFYVYAYAFGDCLVNSLYAVYEQSDEGFVEKYFDMLRAGGSKHHSELLAPFGLDAADPEFWSLGLNVIARMIDELEGL